MLHMQEYFCLVHPGSLFTHCLLLPRSNSESHGKKAKKKHHKDKKDKKHKKKDKKKDKDNKRGSFDQWLIIIMQPPKCFGRSAHSCADITNGPPYTIY